TTPATAPATTPPRSPPPRRSPPSPSRPRRRSAAERFPRGPGRTHYIGPAQTPGVRLSQDERRGRGHRPRPGDPAMPPSFAPNASRPRPDTRGARPIGSPDSAGATRPMPTARPATPERRSLRSEERRVGKRVDTGASGLRKKNAL